MILIETLTNKENLPPEAWRAIAEIAVAILGFFSVLFVRNKEKKSDKKKAIKAVESAIQKTKDGLEVHPEKELE